MKKIASWFIICIMALSFLGTSAELGVQILDSQDNQMQSLGVQIIDGTETPLLNNQDELKPGEKIKQSGNYAIEFTNAIMRTDETLQHGFWIVYLDSKEDGAEEHRFQYPIGTHMPTSINFVFTNMAMDETELLRRVKCELVYDEKYVFDSMAVQENPNQPTSEGWVGPMSTVGRPVEPLVSVDLSFFVAMPIPIRDSDKPLVARLIIDGSDIYEINLRAKNATEVR